MAGTKITSNVIADDAIAAAHIGDGVITTAHISSSATPTFTDLTLTGNLTVQGTTTTLDTATLNVEDKNITLNYGSGDTSSSANGAGITIQDAVDASNDATILWDATNDEFDFSHKINVTGDVTLSGQLTVGSGNNIVNAGNMTIDAGGDITLDADGGDVIITDGGTEKARFKGEKLGIGINPSEMLDVQSNSGDARLRLDAPSGSDTEIKFFNNASAQYTIGHDDATDNFVIGLDNVDTPKVSVNKSGKVDIGNTSFLYGKLTVTQTSGADNDEGGIGIVDSSNGRSMRLYCSSTKSFINSGNGGGQLLVLNEGAGQVSIGNDDAGSMHSNANKLVVGTGSGDQGMSIFAGTSIGRYAFARAVGNNTDAYDGGMAYDGSRNLTFHTNAGSERLRINGSGHMGFGTTDLPSGMSSSGYKQFKIGGAVLADSGHSSGHNVELMNNLYVGSGNDRKFTHAAAAAAIQMTGGKIYFRTHDGGGASADATASVPQRMQIHNNGRVAIGDHSPEGPLDIKGGSYNSIILGSNRTDNSNKLCGIASYMYTNNKVSLFQGSFANGTNALYYGSADGSYRGLQTHYFYTNSNYNATSSHTLTMQINSTNSTALVVYGNNSTGGTVNWISTKGSNESHAHYGTNGNWYIRPANNSGTVYVKNYQAESDSRLKENIENIEYGTTEILQLRPRKFNWIGDSTEQNGFIAQEVESIIPAFVSTSDMKINEDDEEGIKAVDYNSIVAALVKTVQELEARIETLEG